MSRTLFAAISLVVAFAPISVVAAPAATYDLTTGAKAGDVIQTIGDEKVTDVGDLREAVREFDEGDEFTIGVLRHGKTQKLTATMDQQEFSFYDGGMMRYAPRALRVPRTPRVHVDRESLRDEINDLKKEIREMKEQLERQDS